MSPFKKHFKEDFMLSVEIVLMRKGDVNYNLVVAKLGALYNCSIVDCYDHPEYLRTVLKEVYKEDYNTILENIKIELDKLVDIEKEKAEFLKIMES